ncbi:cytochrome c biogenesis CcdA family protein [Pseudofrankia sp. BMG5.36]|uniref:cytochrome c biogenesis CcdA family protein n=1 Tax=Pseudofrankia sp. BMG5.36 TaxID=1834512 RepID=UPI0008D9E885|nr:cytochrome c biogenesis CcdA family protein [Pseudofrankia sp. BMG5.36]OHV49365.1 cytochrome C biogenesis protein [Pseudofrankia sp. BMG5.36]
MSLTGLISDGPLLLATPVAAAAGLLSFFSPCVLPLVPGYLSYVTGLSGADLEGEPSAARARRATAPAASGAEPADAVLGPALVTAGATAAMAPGTAAHDAHTALTPDPSPVSDPGDNGRRVCEGRSFSHTLWPSSDPGDNGRRVCEGRSFSHTLWPSRLSAERPWLVTTATAVRHGLGGLRRTGRVTAGTGLFVLGFTVVFVSAGAAFGGLGQWLKVHQVGVAQVLGAVTIAMGLLFAGVFSRFSWANREFRIHRLPPTRGLLGAPLLGALFGLGWAPCLGPTLAAVQGLAVQSATAGRGAFLSAVYCLGLGVPFVVTGLAFRRVAGALRAVRSHARLLTVAGGALLVAVGVLQVTGQWADLVATLRPYAPGFAETPL